MPPLYQLNGIDFAQLLQQEGNSKTYISNNLWKYYYFLTYLLNKRRYTTLKDGWVKVSVRRLKRELKNSAMGGKNRWFIDRIRSDFKRWNIILRQCQYKTLEDGTLTCISKAKIRNEALALGWREWTPNKKVIISTSKPALTGVYAQIQRSLSLLSIEKEADSFADKALAEKMPLPDKLNGWFMETDRHVNQEVWSYWKSSIKKIRNGYYEVHVQYQNNGRVYTVVTSFPKLIKRYLRLNGKKLVQLDCSCSQPLLLAALLQQKMTELTPDMLHYIDLVQSGQFYGYLKQLLTFYNLPFSDSFKGEFFAKIFYSKEKQFGPWRCLFHHYFPGVSEFILRAKRVTLGARHRSTKGRMVLSGGSPELLSNRLSLLESDIMIQGVAKRLYGAGHYEFLTIHDALLVPEDLVDVAYNVMQEEYQRRNVSPTIKCERID